uniref:glutamate cyclase domain-containing protein n=1 Tax=Thermovirga lienii TaxID=336261 RepID=UPI002FE1E7B4
EDITQWTAPLDQGALMAQDMGVSVLAVGDGGNEVGMGLAKDILQKALPSFEKCLCSVGCTDLIPSDVSNWGAYALVALLSAQKGRWLGHEPQEERAMIEAMVKAGAVDGKTCQKIPSVDGFPSSVHEEKVEELKELFLEWQVEKLPG